MRFDHKCWQPFKSGDAIQTVGTAFHVKLEKEGALFMKDGRKKILIGYGADFRVEHTLSNAVLEATEAGVLHVMPSRVRVPQGEPFVNAEKRPGMSELERAIRGYERRRLLKERQTQREARLEHARLEQKRVAEGAQEKVSEASEAALEEEAQKEAYEQRKAEHEAAKAAEKAAE